MTKLRLPERVLIVGAVTPGFDPHRDIPMGPWCFAGAEGIYPEWETLPFVDPIATSADAKLDDDGLAAFANLLLPELAERANERHGVSYGTDFWHTLLIRPLLEYLTQLYYRFREAEAVLARFAGEPLEAEVAPADTQWNFARIADFYWHGLKGLPFNAWLSGLALRTLAGPNLRLVEGAILAPQPSIGKTRHEQPQPLGHAGRRLLDRMRNGRASFSGDFAETTALEKLRAAAAHATFDAYLALLPAKTAIVTPKSCRPDTKPAARLPQAFVALARTTVEAVLPRSLTDNFAKYDIPARGSRYVPGKLRVQVPAFMFDEASLFTAAHAVEKGEGLVFVQHGANYGVSEANALAAEIEYRHHAFFSWGWSRHGNYGGRFVPLPAPQLTRWRNRHRPRDGRLLVVGAAVNLVQARLMSTGALFSATRTRSERCRFLDGLASDVFSCTSYRPYPLNNGTLVEDGPYFARRYPNLPQCHDAFHQALTSCRLLVTDHPGATFYLAMTANVPMIGYWHPPSWAMTPEARIHFDRLHELGVLFDDANRAAAQVNAVWRDPSGWWGSSDIQRARELLCHKHARTSALWWWEWAKALWRL